MKNEPTGFVSSDGTGNDSNPLKNSTIGQLPTPAASDRVEGEHVHVKLPSGAIANVSPDASPELLSSLDKMVELAMAWGEKVDELELFKRAVAELQYVCLPPDTQETVKSIYIRPSTERIAKYFVDKLSAANARISSLEAQLAQTKDGIQDATIPWIDPNKRLPTEDAMYFIHQPITGGGLGKFIVLFSSVEKCFYDSHGRALLPPYIFEWLDEPPSTERILEGKERRGNEGTYKEMKADRDRLEKMCSEVCNNYSILFDKWEAIQKERNDVDQQAIQMYVDVADDQQKFIDKLQKELATLKEERDDYKAALEQVRDAIVNEVLAKYPHKSKDNA